MLWQEYDAANKRLCGLPEAIHRPPSLWLLCKENYWLSERLLAFALGHSLG